jgi:hypothetical protein
VSSEMNQHELGWSCFSKTKEENPLVIPFQIGYRAHVPLLESFVQFDESIRSECLLMRIQVLDFAHNYCSRTYYQYRYWGSQPNANKDYRQN